MSSRNKERREVRMKNAADLAEQKRGFERTEYALPEGVESFNAKVKAMEPGEKGKVVEVDFMPFICAAGNPDADEGWGYYRRRFWVHRIPTPNAPKGSPTCCEATFGRSSCRICRWLQTVANPELAKSCRSKGRYLWLLNIKPGAEPGTKENPWHVYETTDWFKNCFPGFLQDAINATGGGEDFCDLKKGLTARLLIKKQAPNEVISTSYNDVTRIDLIPRKHTYSSSLIEKAPCLDNMLIDTPSEQLEELIGGGGAVEGSKRSSGARSVKAKDSDVEPDSAMEPVNVDSDVDSQTEDSATGSDVEPEDSATEPAFVKGTFVTCKGKEYEVLKVSGDGTSLTLEDQDGKQKHVSPGDCKRVPVADKGGSDVEEDSAVEPSDVEDSADSDMDSESEDSAVDSDVEPAKKPAAAAAKRPSNNGKKPSSKQAVKPAAKKSSRK